MQRVSYLQVRRNFSLNTWTGYQIRAQGRRSSLRLREGAFQLIHMQFHLSRETPRTPNGPPWLAIKVVLQLMMSTKPMAVVSNKSKSRAESPSIATPGMKIIKSHNSFRTLHPLCTNAIIGMLSLLCEGAVRLPQLKANMSSIYQSWNLGLQQPRGTPTSLYLARSQERRHRGTATRRQQAEIRNKHL